MIGLIKKLRFNIMNDINPRSTSKANRYFKYAIGEIILVVIGTLIAENHAPILKGGFSKIEL